MEIAPHRQLAARHPEKLTEFADLEILMAFHGHVAALLHHLVERERVLARQGEHDLLLEPRENRAFLDDLPEPRREFVAQHPVG